MNVIKIQLNLYEHRECDKFIIDNLGLDLKGIENNNKKFREALNNLLSGASPDTKSENNFLNEIDKLKQEINQLNERNNMLSIQNNLLSKQILDLKQTTEPTVNNKNISTTDQDLPQTLNTNNNIKLNSKLLNSVNRMEL